MDVLLFSAKAVCPILLMMACGFFGRRLLGWQESFFIQLNKLCFTYFLPLNLFFNIYGVGSLRDINWLLIAYIMVMIVLLVALSWVLAKLFLHDPESVGPFMQASYRSNNAIMGQPLAESLGGTLAAANAGLTIGAVNPLYNILAVLILTSCSHKAGTVNWKQRVRQVITNPLIIGSVSGLLVVLIRELIPSVDGTPVFSLKSDLSVVYEAFYSLSKIASPLMLFCLGARLNFSEVGRMKWKLLLGCVMRLVIAPALAIGIAILLRNFLHLTSTEMPALVATFATPVAIASAVMVQELGGDDQYANQLVVWTTVFSMFTIFVLVALLRHWAFL